MVQIMRIGKNKGFTLIELLVVLAIIALLAGLAAPVVFSSLSKAKESALKHDLMMIRKALDDHYSDNNKYPEHLDVLVEKRYLRTIPEDPFTEKNDSWILLYNESGVDGGGIEDVKSGAEGISKNGERYNEW